MKRVILFILTNLAVMLGLGIVFGVLASIFGAQLQEFEYGYLMLFAIVYGFLGAFISLLISKPMAKFACGAKTVTGEEGPAERWLVETVRELADRANIRMPEVAIYPGAANAFATGAFRNHALVAVSTDIMGQMTREELRAVLGHEMSHVANGDMVTLTLVQGVLNAFVLFFSRVVARILVSDGDNGRRRSGIGYYLVVMALQTVFGILASLVVFAFSRKREYAADAGSAKLLGTPQPMISALERLGNLQPGVLPDSLKAMGIAGKRSSTSIWSTHPSLEDRVEALRRWTPMN